MEYGIPNEQKRYSRAMTGAPVAAYAAVLRRSVRGSGTMFGDRCVSPCTTRELSETKRNAYSFLHCLSKLYKIGTKYI